MELSAYHYLTATGYRPRMMQTVLIDLPLSGLEWVVPNINKCSYRNAMN